MGMFDSLNPVAAVSGGLQTLGGIAQTLFSGAKKANAKVMDAAKQYKPNQSIGSYYDAALAKYNPNAYNSLAYQNTLNNIRGNLGTGLSKSQDLRGGLATIGTLTNNADRSMASAAASADAASGADLNRVGQSAGMKTREDRVPQDIMFNLLAKDAAGRSKIKNDGFQNIFNGISTLAGVKGKGGGGIGGGKYADKYSQGDDNTMG